MPTLTDLQQTAQGQTLGGIASNTGVAPSNAQTASSLGAKPNASQMAGTPAQQAAAIKESTSSKSTLSYLQRTETGRAKELEGQSKEALDKVTAARELAGLGGKVGAATSAAINVSFALPADTKANISAWTTAHPDLAIRVPELESALSTLQTALSGNDNAATMAAWKKIKQDFNLSTEDVANMYKIDPAALSTKLQSTFPPGIKMKDLVGVADSAQIEAAKKLMPAESLADFDNMTWQDAKALMNKTLDDATANVTELQKQASDRTLPESTRKMAVQRLRELGVSGEYQAAGEIQDIQGKAEDADNVTIGDKTYEVQDVLQSPEAMDAIKKVLETGDVSSLNGTPFEGLKDLINNYGKDLADKFGIKWGETLGTNKLAATEKTRTDNETAIKGWLTGAGIPVPTSLDKDTLKVLGITDDVINGYSSFDTATIANNPVLKVIQNIPAGPERAAKQAAIWSTISNPGMLVLLDGTHPELVKMLETTAGQETLKNISRVSTFVGTESYKDDKEVAAETKQMLADVGIPNVNEILGIDLAGLGVDIPAGLDTNSDGKLDASEVQKSLTSGKSLEEVNSYLSQLKNIDISKVTQQQATDSGLRNTMGLNKPLTKETLTQIVPGISKSTLDNITSRWLVVDPTTGQLKGRPGDGRMRDDAYWEKTMKRFSATDAKNAYEYNKQYADLLDNTVKQMETAANQSNGSPTFKKELSTRIDVLRKALQAARSEVGSMYHYYWTNHVMGKTVAAPAAPPKVEKVAPERELNNKGSKGGS